MHATFSGSVNTPGPSRRGVVAMLAACGLLRAAIAPAEPATLELLDGGTIALDRLRGRIVVLNYWATWCAPCRAELTEIDDLAATHPRDLAAIAVLAEARPDPRLLAARAAALRIPIARRFTAGGRRYPLAHDGVPTTYVLDRRGEVAFVKAGAFAPGELRARLRPLLAPGE